MARFVVSGLAELECRDALTAWQEAHPHAGTLSWEVAAVAPAERPDMTVIFATPVGDRIERVRLRRALLLAAVIVAAPAFPSHLVISTLASGAW